MTDRKARAKAEAGPSLPHPGSFRMTMQWDGRGIPPLNQRMIQGGGTQICGWSEGIQLESYGILMVIPPGYCFCGGVSYLGTGVSLVD